MKFFISEAAMSELRRGSLEERLVAVREALQEHHKFDNMARKIMATFENEAIVVDGTGNAWRYRLEDLGKGLEVVRRDAIASPLFGDEAIAKAVFEGTKAPLGAMKGPEEDVVAERLKAALDESSFLKWWAENYPVIESCSWSKKPLASLCDRDGLLMAMESTVGNASEFKLEFQGVRFWLSKWPSNLSERVKSGETFRALIEYIKKIDLFTSLSTKSPL